MRRLPVLMSGLALGFLVSATPALAASALSVSALPLPSPVAVPAAAEGSQALVRSTPGLPGAGGGVHLDSLASGNLPASPVSASLDVNGTAHNVYVILLSAGQSFQATMTSAATSGMGVRLLSGDAADLNAAPVWSLYSALGIGNAGRFTSPIASYYYVDVYAQSGSGIYTLEWSRTAMADDQIPGTMIPASPYKPWSDATWDPDDVYRVPLKTGDVLSCTIQPDPIQSVSMNPDLVLFGPGATSIYSSPALASSTNAGSAADTVLWTASSSGDYYLDLWTRAGYGYTDLSWSVTPVRPTIFRTPNKSSLTYKRKSGKAVFKLYGDLVDQFLHPVTGAVVYLQRSTNKGKTWTNWLKVTTAANGAVGAKVTVKKKATFYVRWKAPATATRVLATSVKQKVTVK